MQGTSDRRSLKDTRKHAVILSGGGAKGAYEIGVMKAILPGYVKCVSDGRQVDPVAYTGTSVGSYNAAYMVSRAGQDARTSLAELDGIWRERIAGNYNHPNGVLRFRANPIEMIDLERMIADPLAPIRHFLEDGAFFAKTTIERTETFVKSRQRLSQRAIELVDFSAFVSTSGLHDLIRDTIDLKKIRANEEQALVIAATNWEEGAVKLFGNLKREGPLADLYEMDDKIGHLAVLASTAIPGIFPPVEIFHTKYVDGGLLINTPLWPALKALRAIAPDEKEYVLHVIYLDPDLKDVPLGETNNTMDTLNRFSALNFASQVNRDIKQAKQINQALELYHVAGKRMQAFKDSAGMILNTLPGNAGVDLSYLVGDVLEGIQKPFASLIGDEQNEYRPITIHRYHPTDTLGGIFGLLAFESGYVNDLINRGFNDAVTHDCIDSGCIFATSDELEEARRTLGLAKAAAAGSKPEVVLTS